MDLNKTELIRLLDLADDLLAVRQMPLYPSKHSRKDFTNHQLFKLSVVRVYYGLDFRRFEDFLKISILPEYLGLSRIPHYTTIQKFEQRQNIQSLEKLLLKFVEIAPRKMRNVGIDASGFRLSHASEHYEKRINRSIKKKDWLKANCFFDLNNLLFLAVKFRKKVRNDNQDFISLWNKTEHLDFVKLFWDKAGDANWIHEIVFESGRKSMIHLRNEKLPIHRTSGEYRKKAKRLGENKKKGKRSLVETVFSILKRVFGSQLKARKLHTQKVELLFKMITCNLMTITRNIFCALLFLLENWPKTQKTSPKNWA